MSVSRRERARCVLKLCEYAARNLDYDFEDATDPEVARMVAAHGQLVSKLRYLMPRASAAWSPSFDSALGAAHSMRVTRLDDHGGGKEALRGHSGVCMACGRDEICCRYAIDLAGSDFKFAEWAAAPADLTDRYAEHLYGYDEAFHDAFVNPKPGELPEMDRGRFVVGCTCLRKAQLRFMLQTLLLDATHEADYLCGELFDGQRTVSKDELYTLDDARCDEFVELQDMLDFAITDEKRPLPQLKVDSGFWSNIDKARHAASEGVANRLTRMLRLRAGETLSRQDLGGAPSKQQQEEDSEDDEGLSGASDDEDEEFSEDEPPQKRRQRAAKGRARRVRVACSEDEAEEDEGSTRERKRTRLQTRRAQEKSPAPASARTKPAIESDDDDDEAPAPAPAPATATPQGRREVPGPSAIGLAGRQRAGGALGSREAVLMGAMELQLRLARQGDAAGAAQCSATILTLQELMEQNRQLAHSRHL